MRRAPGFGAFGAAQVLGAVVSWPQHPVGSAYLSERFPDRRATALSWHTAGGSIGTVAALVSAVVAAAGWRWALVALVAALIAGGGLHFSTLTVGTLFTVIMAASIVGPLIGGYLADRFGRVRTLTVTYIAAAIAVAAVGYAGRSVWVLALIDVCVGVLAYAESSPLLQALFSDLTGDSAARVAFGAFFAISYGVGSLWVAIIGWIISAAGFPTAFAVMAGSFVVAAAIIGLTVREKR